MATATVHVSATDLQLTGAYEATGDVVYLSAPEQHRRRYPGRRVKVELWYFEGCPGFAELLPRVRELVAARADVELCRVESLEEAERVRFLGSPTLRVDGEDVEPGAGGRVDYGLKCRLYRTESGQFHAPPDEWIRRALKGAS